MAMNQLYSEVELFLSAAYLPKMDVLSKSDPFVKVSLITQARPFVLGQTEVVKNSASPSFSTPIKVEYRFEEVQRLLFEVYDFDGTYATHHDFMGRAEVTLGSIMGSRGAVRVALRDVPNLIPGAVNVPCITIRANEISQNRDLLGLQLSCRKLDRKDFFGSSDHFFVLLKKMPDGSSLKVHESGYIRNNLNPDFPAVNIPMQRLCGGDVKAPLVLQVWDFNQSGSHSLIGETSCTVSDLLPPAGKDGPAAPTPAVVAVPGSGLQLTIVHPDKLAKAKKKGKTPDSAGTVHVVSCAIIRRPSLFEYLKGGDVEMALTVAIDFTGSNGDPWSPSSLHYMNSAAPNEYLTAIDAVGRILLDYDANRSPAVFGFGGSVSGGATNHCFALNFDEMRPQVQGVEGIVGAYKNAFGYVSLAGPTYFSPIIRRVADMAQMSQMAAKQAPGTKQKYQVLLLLTDGQMNDMDATIDELVKASRLPMSVVIVGVGGADFSAMVALDADDAPLRSHSGVSTRDLVQFCPFRTLSAAGGMGSGSFLAREVLREIPDQVTEYFRQIGKMPSSAPSTATMTAPPPMLRSLTLSPDGAFAAPAPTAFGPSGVGAQQVPAAAPAGMPLQQQVSMQVPYGGAMAVPLPPMQQQYAPQQPPMQHPGMPNGQAGPLQTGHVNPYAQSQQQMHGRPHP